VAIPDWGVRRRHCFQPIHYLYGSFIIVIRQAFAVAHVSESGDDGVEVPGKPFPVVIGHLPVWLGLSLREGGGQAFENDVAGNLEARHKKRRQQGDGAVAGPTDIPGDGNTVLGGAGKDIAEIEAVTWRRTPAPQTGQSRSNGKTTCWTLAAYSRNPIPKSQMSCI